MTVHMKDVGEWVGGSLLSILELLEVFLFNFIKLETH